MKNNIYFILLFILVFVSCMNSKDSEEIITGTKKYEVIKVPENLNKNLLLNEIATDIRYVKLETLQKNLISEVKKVLFTKNRIIILDPKGKSVLVFDNKGKFLFQKNNTGRGPKEHTYINDIIISPQNDFLMISDPGNRKFIKMDLNGTYLSPIKKYCLNTYMGIFNNGHFVFYSPNTIEKKLKGYGIIVYDENFKFVRKMFPTDQICNSGYLENVFTPFNNGFNFTTFLNDTIYYITEDKSVKKFLVDFGKKKISDEVISANMNPKGIEIVKATEMLNEHLKTHAGFCSNIHESNYIFYFSFQSCRKRYHAFYLKQNKKLLAANNVINNIDFGLFGKPIAFNENNELVTLIYPYNLLEHLQKVKKKAGNTKWQKLKQGKMKNVLKLANSSDDMDNPILMFIRLKEF